MQAVEDLEKYSKHQIFSFTGASTVIWKQSNRIISAGDVIIRKDARLSLNEGFSLRIDGLREEDEGEDEN